MISDQVHWSVIKSTNQWSNRLISDQVDWSVIKSTDQINQFINYEICYNNKIYNGQAWEPSFAWLNFL